MSLQMPPADQHVLARRGQITEALRHIVPDGVIDDRDALRVYESDGLTAYRQPPMLAVLPTTTAEVSQVLAWRHREGVKVAPRGSGASLSGGAFPLADAVLLGTGRFNRVLRIAYEDRLAVVQPGVTNLAIIQAVEAPSTRPAKGRAARATGGRRHRHRRHRLRHTDWRANAHAGGPYDRAAGLGHRRPQPKPLLNKF
jgi:FAD/FMN-containing dehydrogenase